MVVWPKFKESFAKVLKFIPGHQFYDRIKTIKRQCSCNFHPISFLDFNDEITRSLFKYAMQFTSVTRLVQNSCYTFLVHMELQKVWNSSQTLQMSLASAHFLCVLFLLSLVFETCCCCHVTSEFSVMVSSQHHTLMTDKTLKKRLLQLSLR